jgi:hypothetical protein
MKPKSSWDPRNFSAAPARWKLTKSPYQEKSPAFLLAHPALSHRPQFEAANSISPTGSQGPWEPCHSGPASPSKTYA